MKIVVNGCGEHKHKENKPSESFGLNLVFCSHKQILEKIVEYFNNNGIRIKNDFSIEDLRFANLVIINKNQKMQ